MMYIYERIVSRSYDFDSNLQDEMEVVLTQMEPFCTGGGRAGVLCANDLVDERSSGQWEFPDHEQLHRTGNQALGIMGRMADFWGNFIFFSGRTV